MYCWRVSCRIYVASVSWFLSFELALLLAMLGLVWMTTINKNGNNGKGRPWFSVKKIWYVVLVQKWIHYREHHTDSVKAKQLVYWYYSIFFTQKCLILLMTYQYSLTSHFAIFAQNSRNFTFPSGGGWCNITHSQLGSRQIHQSFIWGNPILLLYLAEIIIIYLCGGLNVKLP